MAAKTPFSVFTNSKGVPFAVRIVPPAARYGRNNVLTNDNAEPLIEFYDMRWADDGKYVSDPADRSDVVRSAPGFGPLGQFVSRYRASTLLAPGDSGTRYALGQSGLNLDVGVPEWSLDAYTMREVCIWVATTLANQPTLMHKG